MFAIIAASTSFDAYPVVITPSYYMYQTSPPNATPCMRSKGPLTCSLKDMLAQNATVVALLVRQRLSNTHKDSSSPR